jgi:hypothetical protein
MRRTNNIAWTGYFTISRFFQRRFLPWHLRHLTADPAFRTPQSRQIFMYNLCCCARAFLNGSAIGIWNQPAKSLRFHTPHTQITFSMQYTSFSFGLPRSPLSKSCFRAVVFFDSATVTVAPQSHNLIHISTWNYTTSEQHSFYLLREIGDKHEKDKQKGEYEKWKQRQS